MMKRFTKSRAFWPVCTLLLIILLNLLFTEGFSTVEFRDGRFFSPIIDIVYRATPIILLSIGMTLVIGTGGIDLSVGAVMAIAGALVASALGLWGLPVFLAIPFVILVGFLLGVWNGWLVSAMGVQPIVATLVLMTGGRGIALLVTDAKTLSFESTTLDALANGQLLGIPNRIYLVIVTLALFVFIARRSLLGLWIECTGDNPAAARLAGIPIHRVKILAYGACAALAAVAGLLEAADIKAADVTRCGLYSELDAILAVVIGGTPLIGGRIYVGLSVVGALIIQSLTTTVLMQDVGSETSLLVKGLAVLVVCTLQSPKFRARLKKRKPKPASAGEA